MTPPPSSRAAAFELDLPCARALPLFTAEGERAWAEGWAPTMLSGDTARGSAFRTESREGVRTFWIVTEYDAARGRVGYARHAEGSHLGLVDVQLSPLGGERCRVEVRYTLTPLSDQGKALVERMLDEGHYATFIEEWRRAIEASLSR